MSGQIDTYLRDQSGDNIQSIALDWVICLQNHDVTVEEITRWQEWVDQAPENAAAYSEAERVWKMSAATDLTGLEPTVLELARDLKGERQTEQKEATNKTPFWYVSLLRPQVAAVAAVLLALVGGAVLLTATPGQLDKAQAVASVVTAKAEHRAVTLFDGSDIKLGAASKVDINFSETTRHVALAEGEAYFDVAPDADRSFVVSTPLGDVTAIGTAFNVRLSGNRVMVTVTEGKIRVHPQSDGQQVVEDVPLEAGSALVVSRGVHGTSAGEIMAATPVSWMDKWLVYHSEPMRYVVADLNRYADTPITLMDKKAGDIVYSGAITPEELNDWIAALPTAFPVKVVRDADGSVRIQSR